MFTSTRFKKGVKSSRLHVFFIVKVKYSVKNINIDCFAQNVSLFDKFYKCNVYLKLFLPDE